MNWEKEVLKRSGSLPSEHLLEMLQAVIASLGDSFLLQATGGSN